MGYSEQRGRLSALAVVLGILLGLLGMHTLSGDAVGHGPGMSVTVADAHSAAPHGSADTHVVSSDPSATDATETPLHSAMLMTCVLALLAALTLIVPPSASLALRPRLHRMPDGRASLSRTAPSRPPSHIVLCISRT